MASIFDTGRLHRNQAISIFDHLADAEAQRNIANEQIQAQEEASDRATIGTLGGFGLQEDIRRFVGRPQGKDIALNLTPHTGPTGLESQVSQGLAADLGTSGASAANVGAGGAPIIQPGAVSQALAQNTGGALGYSSATGATAGATGGAGGLGAAGATGTALGGTAGAAGTGAVAGATGGATGGLGGALQAAAGFTPWGALAGIGLGLLATKIF